MKTLEQVLQNALNELRKYPDEVEELANQIHNITKACAAEADLYELTYSQEDLRVGQVV
jgi:hypothetical protein